MTGPALIVGAPIRDRLWILPKWFEHVERATKKAGFDDPMIVLVGDPQSDAGTCSCAIFECEARGWSLRFIPVTENLGPYSRDWEPRRFAHMTMLRNLLLDEVRGWDPDFFWSLDSDILAHEDALTSAVDALTRFDAVGQRCYMTDQGTWCPSYAMFAGAGGLLRHDADGCFRVDCIMASKVMSPKAYAVSYETHEQGEDIGWSKACHHASVTLGWDGRTVSKHVMHPGDLLAVDDRCGF